MSSLMNLDAALNAVGSGAGGSSLAEFKAGKMILKHDASSRNMMHADPRKGLVRVKRESDGLVHFQWLERLRVPPGAPPRTSLIDDLIIFPGEARMKKLSQAGDRRIYLLKFEQGDRKLFFWMQEPEASSDDELVRKVNIGLNGEEAEPSSAAPGADPKGGDGGSAGAGSGSGGAAEGGGASAEGGGAPAEDGGADGAAEGAGAMDTDGGDAPQGGGVSQAELAAALLAASIPSASLPTGGVAPGPSLAEVLRPEAIVPLLRSSEIQDRLREYLPEEHRSETAILELAGSTQFQQQLQTFSAALQSGELDLHAAFGIRNSPGFSVADFLRSIEEIATQEAAQADRPAPAKRAKGGEDAS